MALRAMERRGSLSRAVDGNADRWNDQDQQNPDDAEDDVTPNRRISIHAGLLLKTSHGHGCGSLRQHICDSFRPQSDDSRVLTNIHWVTRAARRPVAVAQWRATNFETRLLAPPSVFS